MENISELPWSMEGVSEDSWTVHNVSEWSWNVQNVSGDNVSSVRQPPLARDALYIVIPVTVVYAAIFVAGLLGNVGTCVVIARNRHLHTATNYYLFSLAVSDLLLLLAGLPQEVYAIWSRYPYVFGEAFCVLQSYAAETSANATVLTITAFTVERYVAICHPFQAHAMSRLSRAVRFVLCIWLLALGLAVPQASQFGVTQMVDRNNTPIPEQTFCSIKSMFIPHAFEVSTFVFFVAPMSLITVLYVLIGLRLRRSRILNDAKRASVTSAAVAVAAASTAPAAPEARPTASANQAYVIRMLVAVVVAFFICWAPHHSQRLLAMYARANEAELSPVVGPLFHALTYISGVLYYLSTAINPVLYHIMSHKFREAFKMTLLQHCGVGRGRRSTKRYNSLARPLTSLSAARRTASARRGLYASPATASAPTAAGAANGSRLLASRRLQSAPAQAPGRPPPPSTNCFRPRGASECSQATASTSLGASEGAPLQPVAGQVPRGRSQSLASAAAASSCGTISNSSLQDLDHTEWEGAELALYMGELNQMNTR